MHALRIFLLIFFVDAPLSCHYDLLHAPAHLTPQKLAKLKESYLSSMTWSWGPSEEPSNTLTFTFEKQKTSMRLVSFQEPCLATLSPFCTLTTTLCNKPASIFYNGEYSPIEILEITVKEYDSNTAEPISIAPRSITEGYPEIINVEDLASLVKTLKCVIYTGAGISASHVSQMKTLEDALEFSTDMPFDQLINRWCTNSMHYKDLMHQFFLDCLIEQPTPAHCAIAAVSRNFDHAVLTENVDLLHEASGLDMIKRDESTNWINQLELDQFKEIPLLICVGLSGDWSGLLTVYKQLNPKGTILAIDLVQPPYLGSDDLFLEGDCQELLPELCTLLSLGIKN